LLLIEQTGFETETMRLFRQAIRIFAVCACFAPASYVHAQDETPFGGDLQLPGIVNYAPANVSAGALAQGPGVELFLDARLADESDLISKGLIWRVFGSEPGNDGKLPLLATAEGGSTRLQLDPGSYLVHAAFGRAGATTRITLGNGEPRHETMVLNAGGLRLEGVLPDNIPMRADKLTFDIYDAREKENGERQLILPNVRPGRTVRLNAGTYHVVSNYGDVNATIRADIRVEAGKTTTAKVEHRAAQITLNLVRGDGGYPLADTAWSVLGPSGEIIAENVGAFPTMILAAGDYTVLAKNKTRIFQRDITIRPGRDIVVKVDTETAEQINQ
jgi:preprotein translocase subunit YajC